MRVAALDCGTNSIRLLIADVDGDRLTDVTRQMQIVRLGEGVDRTGRIGHQIVSRLLEQARELGVARVFCLTFETRFFGSFGFTEIDGAPVPHAVYEQLLRSYDEGVAEFLDLERVKPNTLGNTRMLLHL